MTKASFEKIDQSAALLYGPAKLLLCGFTPRAQSAFRALLAILNMSDLPIVWVGDSQIEARLGDLVQLPDGSGEGLPSDMPRAIIVSGITQGALHRLMSGCRKAGMKKALWAVLTPTSEKWLIQRLLRELTAERDALSK